MTKDSLQDLIENFSLFDDWESRYQYLIELGDSVPPMDDAFKTEATQVKGCVSKVWLHSTKNSDGRWNLIADSDGKITKGLVYLVLAAYDGKTGDEIRAVDIESGFAQLGLDQHLSPQPPQRILFDGGEGKGVALTPFLHKTDMTKKVH